jgi:hypothetical protein
MQRTQTAFSDDSPPHAVAPRTRLQRILGAYRNDRNPSLFPFGLDHLPQQAKTRIQYDAI